MTHAYGKVLALDNVSFDLPSGRMTGLIGPDGAGKSTLLGLIAGARKLQIGTVQVLDGSMANARHRRAVCTRIAYMPQGLGKNLYQEISVAENLAFFGTLFGLAAGEREMRIRQLAGATGLLPFLDRPAGKLSGGMKQKLGLCCALIHDPDLLILDEPTTGVDPLSRRQFWTLIADLRRERPAMSVVVSTAYMDEASHCDWLVAMDHGKMLAFGTADELREATGEQDLESVFVALQPGQKSKQERFVIPPRKPSAEEPVIVAKGLTRRFGNFTAVDRVSFTIEKGEIFGFLGSNGCGKTTTMKMLTGLLAPSEGEAEVCGSPVDAKDLSIRRRVGFMTQSFSLYGELTVRQNLLLHARLFHLSRANAADRSEKLIKEVGLTDYADAEANSLPLGVRQRLSLAVAIVHDPELLILDEPTSGVDPQARDEFWRLLVDLSRSRNVTIFVSTHFMNEAMRCDRISLMHAGRVLVCDTPENVIASKNGADLEEAFIAYIEEAEGSRSAPAAQEAPSLVRQEARATSPARPRFMPLRRLFAYTQCEMLSLMRDPVRLAFAFLGSFIIMLIFGFGLSNDVTNLTYAAFDHDNTPESRAYLGSFSSSRYFTERSPIQNVQAMEDRLKSNEIELAIEIPPNFGRMVKRGSDWQVSAWIDGANTTRAATIEGYVQQAHDLFSEQRSREASTPSTSDPTTTLQVRYRYNPTAESIYSIGPSLPAMLMMMFLANSDGGERRPGKGDRHDHQFLCDANDPAGIPDRQAGALSRRRNDQFRHPDGDRAVLVWGSTQGQRHGSGPWGSALHRGRHWLWTLHLDPHQEPSDSGLRWRGLVDAANHAILGDDAARLDARRRRAPHGPAVADDLLHAHERRRLHQGAWAWRHDDGSPGARAVPPGLSDAVRDPPEKTGEVMIASFSNIFWLGTKELRTLAKDLTMILFII